MPKDVTKFARPQTSPLNREGEGVLVEMQISPVMEVGGISVAQLRGDLSMLPVPDRHYTADICGVQYRRETVYVLFGQERFGKEPGLRNLVVVRMTPASVEAYLKSWDGTEGTRSFDKLVQATQVSAEELTDVDTEPKETVTLSANIVLSAASGRESCLDFYYASPFSKAAVSRTNKLALDPVVRVDLRTGLLLGLYNHLKGLIVNLPSSIVLEGVTQGD